MFNKFLASLLIFWGTCASAMMPENGVWWNPNEGGTGYTFEIQNNRLWMYAYTYETNGLPVYLYSATLLTGQNQFTGTLSRSQNGPCITCAYHSNTEAPVGSVSITFDSPSTATLTATTANGTRSTRLQRFPFATDERNPYKMMGEWSLVTGTASFPVYFAERIAFGGTFTSNGSLWATGARTGSSSNIAVARQETDGSWSILLDSSTSYFEFYNFRFSGLNTMEGKSWTFLKTDSPTGSGIPFIGLRSGTANSVTGTGPALQRRQITPDPAVVNGYESINTSKAQFSGTPSTDPEVLSEGEKARKIVLEILNP